MSQSILIATRKGLFTAARTGTGQHAWQISKAEFLGDPVPMVLPDARDGSLYAVLEHGHFGTKVHRCRAGETWEEITTPAYPEPPEGVVDLDSVQQRPIPWRLQRIWALEAGGAEQPGVLWCGTIPGGLFRSPDAGSSWELIRALWDHPSRKRWFGGGADYPGIHSLCLDPRDSRRLLAGVSCGGVWETCDGGQTWENRARGMFAVYMPPEQANDPEIQDPHRVVLCPAAPDYLWAQHHNGIFRSTDGARSWQEVANVPPSSFGFAVAVHPHHPDTAWFVPAQSDQRRIPVAGKVVVTRTRDGGKTFDVLTTGLPQENAYDLTYRHCLEVNGSGEVLAFGTTTGSVWISEDQGDTWQALSHHLPPVYCVRFRKE
jgi:hypothetical protein